MARGSTDENGRGNQPLTNSEGCLWVPSHTVAYSLKFAVLPPWTAERRCAVQCRDVPTGSNGSIVWVQDATDPLSDINGYFAPCAAPARGQDCPGPHTTMACLTKIQRQLKTMACAALISPPTLRMYRRRKE